MNSQHLLKKRILQINKYEHPDKGGIESVTQQISELSSHWIKFKNLSFANYFKKYQRKTSSVRFASFKLFSQPLSFRYFLYILLNIKKYDQVILHYPNLLGALALLISNVKADIYIYWHSDVVQQNKLLKIFARRVEKKLLQKSRCVIFATKAHRDYSNQDFSSLETKILPYTISNEQQAKITFNRRKKIKHSQKIKVLFVGRLVIYKGIDIILNLASNSNKQMDISIVGNGPLEKKIRLHDAFNKNIFLFTNQDNNQLEGFFEESDVLILPSINKAEMFGIVQLEAFSRGIPVVTSRLKGSGINYVNTDGISGMSFINGDHNDLKEKILYICANKEKYGPDSIRNYYKNNYSNDAFRDKLLKIFEN